MTEFIKCCPFCGSDKVIVCKTNSRACWIRCDKCGADAESHSTRKKAIANWNRRIHKKDMAAIVVDDEKNWANMNPSDMTDHDRVLQACGTR